MIDNTLIHNTRTPFKITLAVWKALFLREAVVRLSTGRIAWLWLLIDPMIQIVFLIILFTTIRMRVIVGMDTAVWILVGVLAFTIFRNTAIQGMNAIGPNRALFNYRQVKPVDTVLVRAVLEGFLLLIVSMVLCSASAFIGLDISPDNLLLILSAVLSLWLIGLGFGLVTSVIVVLLPDIGKILKIIMMPLYLCSGVIWPLNSLPVEIQEVLWYNPLVHCVDAVRLGFSSQYQVINELSLLYSYGFGIVFVFMGLAIQIRFATQVKTL